LLIQLALKGFWIKQFKIHGQHVQHLVQSVVIYRMAGTGCKVAATLLQQYYA